MIELLHHYGICLRRNDEMTILLLERFVRGVQWGLQNTDEPRISNLEIIKIGTDECHPGRIIYPCPTSKPN